MIILETHRLILRHFHVVDGEAMDLVFGDADVMRFSSGTRSSEWVRKWLQGCLKDYHERWGFGFWAVVEKREWRVIGFCGLTHFPDIGGQPETKIGYRLARAYWGRGLATEAAGAVKEYGFEKLCMSRLISLIDAENVGSIRVAEKIGLCFEKDIIYREVPVRVYAAAGGVGEGCASRRGATGGRGFT